jgi:hypothetical protein
MFPSPGILYESAFYRVELLPNGKVVKVTRLPMRFESQDAVDAGCEPVQTALDASGRRTHHLLIDVRGALGDNDPGHELWFQGHRRRMLVGFPRVAIVAQTVIGKMHADRLNTAHNLETPPRVFLDEGLALRFLTEG